MMVVMVMHGGGNHKVKVIHTVCKNCNLYRLWKLHTCGLEHRSRILKELFSIVRILRCLNENSRSRQSVGMDRI